MARTMAPTNTRIDPRSPAAAEIARIAALPGAWPTFRDIPAIPADIRTPAQWRQSVLALRADGADVVSNAGAESFSLGDTDRFAAGVRGQLDARAAAPPTAAEIAESAAFVKAARARATPPPRPH